MKRAIDVKLVKKNDDGHIHCTIDGKQIVTEPGKTVWEAAIENGIDIPVLCHQDERMPKKYVDLNPIGVCRLCCVEVGEIDTRTGKVRTGGVLAPSCMRPIEEGMVISTTSKTVDTARRTLIELLLADHPQPSDRHKEHHDCELELWAEKLGIKQVAFPGRTRAMVEANKGGQFADAVDHSNPSIRIDHASCIVCDRCVRACTDIKQNNIIGRVGKGYATTIGFDLNLPMAQSQCVNCGECMITCPTGAITYGQVAADVQEGGVEFKVEDLLKYDIFQGISSAFLERAISGIKVRHPAKGEVLCRQAEYGATAFYITAGECRIYIDKVGVAKAKKKGPIESLKSLFTGRKTPSGNGESKRDKTVAIDATVDLQENEYGQWVNTLKAGDIVGELACINNWPRSATVVADSDDVEIIEMGRNVLELLRRNKAFRDRIDAGYKARALGGQLQNVPLFEGMPPEFLKSLEQAAQLQRLLPGQVIFAEGDLADAFFIVRGGHVKVTRKTGGGEVVLDYLRRGAPLGEIAMLGALGLVDTTWPGADGKRTATCTALDAVDLVRFDKETFGKIINGHPQARVRLVKLAEDRLRADPGGRKSAQTRAAMIAGDPRLQQFLDQGLYQAQSMLVIDLERCTRCDECVRACADAHDGISRFVRDGQRFGDYLVAASCRACHDPKCMVGCPTGAIRRVGGSEIVIADSCIGCELCFRNCPFGSIEMQSYEATVVRESGAERETVKKAAQKASVCDLSREWKEPACVYACPHNAAHRVEAQSFFDHVVLGEPLKEAPHAGASSK
jgi:Fe-S-cluster-containing hydrogenase component 2